MHLTDFRTVDLTHPLSADIPIWQGDPAIEISPWASYRTEGYFINRLTVGEHSGTHWSTPNTFIPGGRSADQFMPDDLILPAVGIDVREQVTADPDFQLTEGHIHTWEAQYSAIPTASLVILFTGWDKRWHDSAAFFNRDADGVMHTPGFAGAVVSYLVAERGVRALGTDTHGIDAGTDSTFAASNAIFRAGGFVLECLAGLSQLPPVGATVMVGALPVVGGSGSPARVMALVPR